MATLSSEQEKMYKHWTQALDHAIVATYIWSETAGVSMDIAREHILIEAQNRHNGDLEDCCWTISFSSTIKVPYHPTVEEVLTPMLAEYGISWEQFINHNKLA